MRPWSKNWFATRTETEQSVCNQTNKFSKTVTSFYSNKNPIVKKPKTSKNKWRMNIITLDMLKVDKKLSPINKGESSILFDKVDQYIKKVY